MLAELLQWNILFPWFLGMVFGVFVGATPGLTATMAVALIVPISFYLPPNAGLALIIGVSFTAIFAGDIPATYLRIPGTPASAAATLDGHVMAQRGQAQLALGLDLLCSCLGGMVGVGLLILLAPQLARFSLRFSNFEYFWLAVLGLSMSAVVSSGRTYRGLLSAAVGMLISTVGIDVVSGSQRYTFGSIELMSGIGFIPVMIGLFGISEVLRNIWHPQKLRESAVTGQVGVDGSELRRTMWRYKGTLLKSSTLGTLIGALPGAGADIAAWAAYGLAQRTSKHKERFGQGTPEGVVAPTSANNAAVGGAWIPALVFGIPGDSVTAIVLGALLMYDLKPGPMLFEQSGAQVQAIFVIALVTQLLLLPAGYIGIKTFRLILKLPRSIVLTAVVVCSVVGAYALRNSLFDVYLMVAFGLVGFALEAGRVPLAPLILGLILGPMVEENLRTGLIKSEGSWMPFVNRPICAVLILILLAAFLGPLLFRCIKSRLGRAQTEPG